jgi:hypothetical protein
MVLGDQSAQIGSGVTFWGAQWASLNGVSSGAAPDSFKGFASGTAEPPSCGMPWQSGPGNSSGPPATVPAFMGVLVSSAVDKSGPTISSNTVRIVVVQTQPGYGPNPGHPGTGTVIAEFCHQ